MLKVLDLFSGIGGFSLGLERTGGFKTIAFCEIDNYCQRVLKKHWPEVYIHSDIRTLTAGSWEHFGYPKPDVITGGFPCQDVSKAGGRAGIAAGTRSGLWTEMRRLICELRPRLVIVENVTGLLERGIGIVLGDLAESGYDAEWDCLPAAAFGAPHLRDRTFIVAYPNGERPVYGQAGRLATETRVQAQRHVSAGGTSREIRGQTESGRWAIDHFEWIREPKIRRVVDGIPGELDKGDIKCFGNSIVPQIATWIGERILEAER